MTARAIKAAALCAWLLYTYVLGALYLQTPPSPDLQIFDYAGWIASRGGRLYVDVVEQNWPGAMWLHTLAAELFGSHMWSFRALDYGLVCASALALAALLRQAGARTAGFIVVPVYQAMYVCSDVWFTGQRDVITGEIVCTVALLLALRQNGRSRLWMLGVGAGVFLAMMVRPTYLACAPLLILADILSMRDTGRSARDVTLDALVAAGAFLACIGLLAVYAHSTGALAAFKEASLDFNTQAYAPKHHASIWRFTLLSTARAWYGYWAFGILGTLLWFRYGQRPVLRMLFALMVCTGISVLAARAGFGYHYGSFMPVMALLFAYAVGFTIDRAREEPSRLRVAFSAVVVLGCVLLVGRKLSISFPLQVAYLRGQVSYQEMMRDGKPLAEGLTYWDAMMAALYIKQHSKADDTVLVWDRAVLINTLAERRSPTPFITSGMLRLADPPFVHSDKWNGMLRAELEGPRPPAFIVIPGPENPDHADTIVLSKSVAVATLKRALSGRYRLAKEFGSLDVYAPVR